MGNIVDNIIGFLNPAAGAKRVQHRRMYERMKRSYEGAGRGRRTDGWRTGGGSANTEILESLDKLRERSRDLVRNNPYAEKIVEVISTNVVGTGIAPTPVHKEQVVVDRLKEEWKLWAETTDSDFYGKTTLYGNQDLTVRAVAESGECLIRKRYVTDRAIPIQIQVMEADFLDSTKDVDNYQGGGYIRGGIQYDENDRVKGYWLYNNHPSERFQLQSSFVPADEIIHCHEVRRPGQQRGAPRLSSAIMRLRDLDEFEDAELVRQKIAACFAAFVTTTGGLPMMGQQADNELLAQVEPGAIQKLLPGETVVFGNPPAKEGYAEYVTKNLHGISAGAGVTYESMTHDYSQVNFSSARMGWLEFQRSVLRWQWHMLIPQVCNRLWDWFIEGLMLAGKIRKSQIAKATWTTPRREMISPVEEMKALMLELRAGLKSWSEAVRERGLNPEELIAEIIADATMFDKAGLKPESDPRFDANRVNPNADRPGETEKKKEE